MSPPTAERRPRALLLATHEPGVTPAGFADWCAAQAAGPAAGRKGLRLWLSAELCLDLLAEPGLRLGAAAAVAPWARRLAAAFEHGDQGAVAGWRSGRGAHAREAASLMLAPADLAELQATAGRHGLRLAGVHPLWAGALAAARGAGALAAHGTLLVAEGRLVCAVTLVHGAVTAIERHWLPDARAEALAELVAAVAAPVALVGHGLHGAPPTGVQVVLRPDSSVAELLRWLEAAAGPLAPDFGADATAPSHRLGWALAGTAALALGLAGLDAGQAYAERHTAAAALSAPASPARSRGPAAAARGAPERAATEAADANRRLRHPWADWFVALEAASVPGLNWVAVEHRADGGRSRLTGRAGQLEQPIAAARQLAAAPVVADARLVRVQADTRGGFEFELALQMAPKGRP